MSDKQKEILKKKRMKKLKELHETINTITKARKIQKAQVDSNVMKEELSQEEMERFHKPLTDLVQEKSNELLETLEEKTTRIPIESSVQHQKSIEAPLPDIKELPSKESSEESSRSLKEPPNIFYPDEGIDKEIVKDIYRFNMPSEILKDYSLYEQNYNRVVSTLKSLGAQKKGKHAVPEIGEYIKALSTYNERIKLIKKALDQQSQTGTGITYKYYSTCDELIERLNLLCGSKDAGNNSTEIRNEIVSILDILLNKGVIDANSHKLLYNKWCC